MSLFRLFRHGPLTAWVAIFALTATCVAVWSTAGASEPGVHGTPARGELIADVFDTRALLGALVSPGEPSDARHVSKVAATHAKKWARYDTDTTNEAAAVFAQLSEHSEMVADAETDQSRRVALSAVLADGDDLIAVAYGGDAAATRTGTYHHHPALDDEDTRDVHLDGEPARDRVTDNAPPPNLTPRLGETPR